LIETDEIIAFFSLGFNTKT